MLERDAEDSYSVNCDVSMSSTIIIIVTIGYFRPYDRQ